IFTAASRDVDVVTVDLDVETPRIVGEWIERAAAHEVEASVVPVAGDDSALDGAAVQREAHVRAPARERVRAIVLPEQDDRQLADLGQQPTGLAQLRQGAGPHARNRGAAQWSPRPDAMIPAPPENRMPTWHASRISALVDPSFTQESA